MISINTLRYAFKTRWNYICQESIRVLLIVVTMLLADDDRTKIC